VEAVAVKSSGSSKLIVNGIVQSEEIRCGERKLVSKSAAIASIENVIAALKTTHNLNTDEYDIYLNFSAPTVVDGPSAGCAVFCALYSAMLGLPLEPNVVITGEMSISGRILPVGQIKQKIAAAKEYGAGSIVIPGDNGMYANNRKSSYANPEAEPRIIYAADSDHLVKAVTPNCLKIV